jgi:hypothetical protein
MTDHATNARHFSYSHPVKRIARKILGLRACECGCDVVQTRRSFTQFPRLGRVGKWATRDPNGD